MSASAPPPRDIFALGPVGGFEGFVITAPGTQDGNWLSGLAGMHGAIFQVNFDYASGSGGVRLCLQSSMDNGDSAYDVAVLDFAAVTRRVLFTVVHETSSGFLSPGLDGAGGSPDVEGIRCPILGERLRARVFVTGTYQSPTLLSVTVNPIF